MIILIILAAITINLTVGDSGIITRAEEAAFKTEASAMMEEYDLYIANKSIDGTYEVESLTAEENSLMYGGERLEGNIQTILPGLSETSKKDYEIIKGELYYKSQDVRKLKWALEIGMKVNPFIIIDGVLISTDVNLGLLDNTGVITIPETVTKIDKGTFNNLAGIKKVIIPGTVKEIADNAFSNNTTIEEIIIEDGVERVGDYAFYGCSALKEIAFPDSVIYIGRYGIAYCKSLEKVELSNNITLLQHGLLQGDRKLVEVQVPEKVNDISAYVFSGCANMIRVNLSKNVQVIGQSAFSGMDNLETINIASENDYLKFENGILLSKDGSKLYFALKKLTNIEIPNSVTNIMAQAFAGTEIERIKLSNNLTKLSGIVFYGMNSLREIVVNIDNPNYIVEDDSLYSRDGTELIRYIAKGSNITIRGGVKRISSRAIVNSSANKITQINLPNSLEILDDYALSDCNKVTHIDIPKNVSQINPHSLIYYGTIAVSEENPYFKSVDNMILSKDGKKLVTVSKIIKNFEIPNTVEVIEKYSFQNNQILEEISIPASTKNINLGAFQQCGKLKKITIPNTVEVIASNAFENCDNLTEIIITKVDPNKKEGSIEGSPWGCPYGARAVKWEK